MKKIAAVICNIFLILSLMVVCPQAFADNGDDISHVNDAQHGVVRVMCGYSDFKSGAKDYLATGTAFAVGKISESPEYFVTNYHVIEEDVSDVRITNDDMYNSQKVEVVYFDDDLDIAILKTPVPLEDIKALVLLSSDKVEKGQSVWCLGFPGLADIISDGGSSLSSTIEDLTISGGTISNNNFISDDHRYILSDVTINSGNSGGPMINNYGQVIGVNSIVIRDTNSMSMSICIDQVMDILDKEDIDYMVGDADGSAVSTDGEETYKAEGSNKGMPTWLVILLVLLICGGICFAAIFIYNKYFREKGIIPVSVDSRTVTVDTGDYANLGSQCMLGITCEVGPKGIMGLTRTYTGKVRVGRNSSSCQLVFPEGTPGVSREHCDIRLTEHGIIVKDLNSTYGTILGDGTKLSGGVEKNIGDDGIILIGSEKNILSCKKINF